MKCANAFYTGMFIVGSVAATTGCGSAAPLASGGSAATTGCGSGGSAGGECAPVLASSGEFDAGNVCQPEVPCGTALMAANPLQPTLPPTVTRKTPPPPISGGTLIVLKDGITAVVADADRDNVYVVNLSTGLLLYTIALEPGDEPGRLIEDGTGHVHIALRGSGALVTVDPLSGTVITRRTACPAPRGVGWDKAADLVWVACATGELVALPAAGGAPTKTLIVERDLRDIIVRADGTLTVTSFRSAEVLRLTSAGTVSRRDSMPPIPPFLPHVAWRAVAGPGGDVCAVHQEHSTLSLATKSPGGYGSGSPEDGAVMSVITDMAPDGEIRTSGLLPGVLPVDLAVSPDGMSAAVVAAGDGFVGELPDVFLVALGGVMAPVGVFTSTVLPSFGPLVGLRDFTPAPAAGPAPVAADDAGVIVDEDASPPAFFSNQFPPGAKLPGNAGAQATAVAFEPSGELVVFSRQPAVLFVLDAARSTWKTITLSSVSREDTGHDIFHSSAGALVACASCHPEGGEDNHVWTLDGALRRTPSLRGTIAGTAPYHWPGDEADIVALANDVYTGRMNGEVLGSDQMSALTNWVEAIPAPPAPTWVDAAAASRGKTLFESGRTQCVTCHSGPKMTNNATVDVGTGGPFQVPPLVGVGWRTPLLHNGCANTIADRFGVCGTPGHGSTAALSEGDISDLSAYLETL